MARRNAAAQRTPAPAPNLLAVRPGPSPALAEEPVEPFIKWAGGKSRVLPELLSRLPPASAWRGRYFEPFLGGGALYLHSQPRRAVLADTNPELVNLYTLVRDDPEALIANLSQHPYERAHFYAVRAIDPATLAPVERAARFVFLNRTCFNGLWRVNRAGQFNVPFGRHTNPTVCPSDRIRAASRALTGATLLHADFDAALTGARAGDFVYLDPPYVPLTPTASFTSYTATDFGLPEQRRLADRVRELTARGVLCMLSNSDTPLVRELYAGFRLERILVARSISRTVEGRAPVGEVIVRNW